ncbi:MAG: hypothetical protein JRE63_11760 [Deltaproteobacteria bacterium]|jgi:L-arabinokinase|nr:hypothetical protein [Deltaproteobacteria bacterium]MBW2519100.1 hypothetical protein [Deltaproteobacteria bacterium]
MPKLRYYISGHGLGHASRSLLILRTIAETAPNIGLEVVTNAPAWFLSQNLPSHVSTSHRSLDVGMVQSNSLEMQLEATLERNLALIKQSSLYVHSEAENLKQAAVDLVITDIAALPCLAAAQYGCPSVLLSNFSWDWIYAPFAVDMPDFAQVVEWHERAYAKATLALRLPFHSPLDQPKQVFDLPLVARLSSTSAMRVRQTIGLEPKKNLGLVSFGGFGLPRVDFKSVGLLEDWVFLVEADIAGQATNFKPLPNDSLYQDLINAADVVITKPGYGIVAETIANQTAVLYTSRGNFREQPLLIEGLERYNRCLEIDHDRFLQGDWQDALKTLLEQKQPKESIAVNGAQVAARTLITLLEDLGKIGR